ncbi:MAG: hypothetical protein MUC88_25820, partial [Planctomycetes bacterium]|nr:hypothetical protein [Planctomycetota bacterium]
MATFGRYEADRPLCRTGFSTLYLVKPTAQGESERVIKAHKPSVRIHDEVLEATQGQAFLESAAVQQKAARLEASAWAPIHDYGTAASGPFYVTDRYEFALQWLIDNRVKVGAAGLYNIVHSVTRGLRALRQACGRPHGNLKLTNILIGGSREMSQARIVLSDPLPDSHLDPDWHAQADLHRLGEIIHQLVVHRGVPQITGYQVPDSEPWRALGKAGEGWRQLCNRLLQVNVESTPITLEDLPALLAPLAPHRSRRMIRITMAVLPGLALCAFLAWLLWPPPPPDPEVVAAMKTAEPWLRPLGETVNADLSAFVAPKAGKRNAYLASVEALTGDADLARLLKGLLSCHDYYSKQQRGEIYGRDTREVGTAREIVVQQLFGANWLSNLGESERTLRQNEYTALADYLQRMMRWIPV